MLPAGTTYQVIPDTVPQDVELHQAQLPVAVPLGSHRLRRKLHSLNQAGAESEQLGRRGDGHREGKIRGDVARACAQPACSPALLALCSREGCKRSDSLGVTLSISHSAQGRCLSLPLPFSKRCLGRTWFTHTPQRCPFLCTAPWTGHSAPFPRLQPLTQSTTQEMKAEDTSMRFTMLRQDSRLKPLVLRSLSARKTSSNTLTTELPGPAPCWEYWVEQRPRRHHSCPLGCKIEQSRCVRLFLSSGKTV